MGWPLAIDGNEVRGGIREEVSETSEHGGKHSNVFVFGAGASLHVGAPLAKNVIFSAICDYCWQNQDAQWADDFESVMRYYDSATDSKMLDFLRECRTANTLATPDSLPDVEDIVTMVEDSQVEGLPAALHDVLYLVISERARGNDLWGGESVFGIRGHRRNLYDQFVDYVLPVTDTNTLISFNYDLALDEAVSLNNHGLLGDYLLAFAHVHRFPAYDRIKSGKRESKDVDLLKLHGSFNWGWCRKCCTYSLSYGGDFRDVSQSRCSSCLSELVPVLVPLSRKKSRYIQELESLWKRARMALSAADTLCVVGYSFNQVDSEAVELFKDSLRENRNLSGLIVADPNCQSIVELLYSHLRRKIDNTVTYASFEEMMASLVGPMKGLLR